MSSLRTFVAIQLSDRLKKSLKTRTKAIQASNPLVHWVAEDNLHLTLCFLGDVELNQFHKVSEIVKESCQEVEPFAMNLAGFGGFPNPKNPRILWAGVEADGQSSERGDCQKQCPALFQLHRSLVKNFLFHRFTPDNKPFRPHVTLGRLPGRKQERQFDWGTLATSVDGDQPSAEEVPTIGSQLVQEVKVFTSEASGPSVTYSVVATIPL